ncbi:NYN domain-containing protein [Corynebacterium simulans]|uniref:NYN domain-containing protein n=1 Tax=Corynebacterium accolens TaxID=38284 RepID=A0A2A4AKV7_9CORY|nr:MULTISPECIES: NYN domain-containing protein [Corynebacterium]PCC83553.1 NYN domain-containing protein [Corynebacterium accolens]AMO89303.1 NYN domain protein [Corynebacterium simulans]AMO91915.1 NYN domain protein [Corynebacterium simulans]MCG7248365.1 NYN domain-containing protein [Corynebacterium simulans]MDK7139032.1 NYN domain-containing protein [Corynebacterium simulans]
MLERTLVFVDTSYLLASFYNSWETGARAQLEIDLPEVVNNLGSMVENQLGNRIHRQYWYDGIPDTGPHRYQRALRTCDGVQLRTGQLIEWGERRTQKAVDTRLVADMILAAMKQQVTDFVLVSGDADMIPGVQEAVNAGVRVHLYGFGWDSMSSALRHACDTTTILDPREDFADAMELQVLEGPLPPTIREPHNSDEELPQVPQVEDECEPSEAEAAFTSAPKPSPSPADLAPQTATTTGSGETAEAKPAAENTQAPQPPATDSTDETQSAAETPKPAAPKPSMMAPRRKLRSKYVPLPEEVWTSAGFQSPFDVGQQYASWWFENAANAEQRDQAHLLSGGGLPPEIDRPLLQFACETLHEYTLSESQRVNLRDGFHSGIRGVLIAIRREES